MALITSSPQKYLFLWILIATNIVWALIVCQFWASYTYQYPFILTTLCVISPLLKGGINFHPGCWHHFLSCLPTFTLCSQEISVCLETLNGSHPCLPLHSTPFPLLSLETLMLSHGPLSQGQKSLRQLCTCPSLHPALSHNLTSPVLSTRAKLFPAHSMLPPQSLYLKDHLCLISSSPTYSQLSLHLKGHYSGKPCLTSHMFMCPFTAPDPSPV